MWISLCLWSIPVLVKSQAVYCLMSRILHVFSNTWHKYDWIKSSIETTDSTPHVHSQSSRTSTQTVTATSPGMNLRPSGTTSLTSASLENWTKTSELNLTCSHFHSVPSCPDGETRSHRCRPSFTETARSAGRRWSTTSWKPARCSTARWASSTCSLRPPTSNPHSASTAPALWVNTSGDTLALLCLCEIGDSLFKYRNSCVICKRCARLILISPLFASAIPPRIDFLATQSTARVMAGLEGQRSGAPAAAVTLSALCTSLFVVMGPSLSGSSLSVRGNANYFELWLHCGSCTVGNTAEG